MMHVTWYWKTRWFLNLTINIFFLIFRDKDDDAGQNKTVKPTATMKLYKDGADISGGSVKLTDIVTMILQLDDEYIGKSGLKAYIYVHKGSLAN